MNLQDANKILVMGGTGFLGSALIHTMISRGVHPSDIRVFYLEGSPLNSLSEIPSLDLCPGNVLDPDSVKTAFQGVTHVFHMIGNTSFDPFKKRIQWLVNVEGTRNALEAALGSESLEKLVYTSTVNTLGVPDPIGSLGTEETSPYTSIPSMHSFPSPDEALGFAKRVHRNPEHGKWWKEIGIGYFDSKLAAQELVSKYAREHGLPVSSVLPGTNFGPFDDFIGSGIYILRIYNNAMPGYTPGGGFRCTHVCDQADGHIYTMERGRIGERYIITGHEEDNLEIGEMFRVIAEVLQEMTPDRRIKVPKRKIPLRVAWFGAVAYHAYARVFKKPCLLSKDALRAGSFLSFYSAAKAERELGFKPIRRFRDAVRDHFEYYKKRGLLAATQRAIAGT